MNDLHKKQVEGQDVLSQINKSKQILCEMHKQIMEGVNIRSRNPTFIEEERSALYQVAKEKHNEQSRFISNITLPDNQVTQTTSQYIKEAERYFSHLYKLEDYLLQAQDALLRHVTTKIEESSSAIDGEITPIKLEFVIKMSSSNSAPGPDGLDYNFYKTHWKLLKDPLLAMMNQIINENTLCHSFNDGIIILIPKTILRKQ